MKRFDGRVVIVTGGSLGIGEAAARGFAAEGGTVVIASRDAAAGESAASGIAATGGPSIHVQTDVSHEPDVAALVSQTLERFGRLDVLVNNAAIYFQGDVAETIAADWDRLMSINLTGAYLCTKHAVDALSRTRGTVINVSSEAGLVGIKGQVAYNVSKAALIALTKSCAVDLAERGIRVNCVCPGTTDTPLVATALSRSPDPASERRHLERVRPLNRLGTADEIASAILYLASDDAAYATGAVLSMDGGYTAQ
jgi:NAD(P)-dependent dehydrogenase (short-subunit alcohol dehydrogenase family)